MRRLVLVLFISACTFSPDIDDGTIQCAHDHSCPPGFICGPAERCFRTEDQTVDGDMRIDTAPTHDAAPDACPKHCMGNPDCCD